MHADDVNVLKLIYAGLDNTGTTSPVPSSKPSVSQTTSPAPSSKPSISLVPSIAPSISRKPTNSCSQNRMSIFVIKLKKNGESAVIGTCKWLRTMRKKDRPRARAICSKTDTFNGIPPASAVCQRTCKTCDDSHTSAPSMAVAPSSAPTGVCYEEDAAYFCKKVKPDGTAIVNTCSWLQNLSTEVRKTKVCARTLGFPNTKTASDVCSATCNPNTCS